LVSVGKPEDLLPTLLNCGSSVLTQEEVTSEELKVDQSVRMALGDDIRLEYCWGSTLFHKEDLPFKPSLQDMPDVYTQFKNKVEPELACQANSVPPSFNDRPKPESRMKVRACLPVPEVGSLPLPQLEKTLLDFEPAWRDLPFPEKMEMPRRQEGAAFDFQGGEDAGLERLKYYFQLTTLISSYFDTRNEMLGPDYSTKIAPWLAHGCLSPRKVFECLREHESRIAANKSTYWVLFALGARDFFRFFAAKHGDAVFRECGVLGRPQRWKGGDVEFELWSQGRTGFPFVDANMRELRATGFMSNRGRQNVASFLIFDLGVDWRRGADWFESFLVDYDVTANWCNWVFAAGLTGGRINRFNVLRQAKNYDTQGAYVRHWLPELREVPTCFIHEPWLMSQQCRKDVEYPASCFDPSVFPSKGGPVPVQLKGLKGYGKSMPSQNRDEQPATKPSAEGKGAPTSRQSADFDGSLAPRRRWKPKQDQASHQSESVSFLGPDWLRQ
jgi:deoxyribodipyrimidine photo-lyase